MFQDMYWFKTNEEVKNKVDSVFILNFIILAVVLELILS